MAATRPIPTLMSTDKKSILAHAVAGQRLMRFIRARVASEADAEDVLQDVWQQLVTSLEAGPIEQVGAWLYTVARRRIIGRYRKPAATSLEALAELGGGARSGVVAQDPDETSATPLSPAGG
jgi:DNA-directed RNA polymerase specialized sigma24 family protein